MKIFFGLLLCVFICNALAIPYCVSNCPVAWTLNPPNNTPTAIPIISDQLWITGNCQVYLTSSPSKVYQGKNSTCVVRSSGQVDNNSCSLKPADIQSLLGKGADTNIAFYDDISSGNCAIAQCINTNCYNTDGSQAPRFHDCVRNCSN